MSDPKKPKPRPRRTPPPAPEVGFALNIDVMGFTATINAVARIRALREEMRASDLPTVRAFADRVAGIITLWEINGEMGEHPPADDAR